MNLTEFTNNLKNPSITSTEQIIALENILETFPYFQAAHFLYLNGLKNQESFKYNNVLKKTAAYTTDRSVLFDYITSSNFTFSQDLESNTTTDTKKEKIEVEIIPLDKKNTPKNKSSEITVLSLGKPLQFDNSETYSFSEWLQISAAKPIVRANPKTTSSKKEEPKIQNPNTKSNFDLIDSFITNKPKIKPSITDKNKDVSMHSITENKSLMTETLAHVYLEQKKYTKAITAFHVLSLKYPEKSGFFANQIKAIQNLQEK